MPLLRSCEGFVCAEGTTCNLGECVDSNVPAESLRVISERGAELVDGGTAAPPAQDQTIIEDDLDDGQLDTAGLYGVSGYAPQGETDFEIYMGGFSRDEFAGEGYSYCYFRFRLDRAISADGDIAPIFLRLYGADTYYWDPSSQALQIRAELSPDAARIESIDDAPIRGGRALTETELRWPASGGLDWRVGDWNDSPDLTPLLREVAAVHDGLASGAHIQFFLYRDIPPSVRGEVAAQDSSHPDDNGPRLIRPR